MFRAIVFIVVVAVCTSTLGIAQPEEQTSSNDREITNVGGSDWRKSWRVPLDRLQRESTWKPDSEPQLSTAEAVKIARNYLHSQQLPDQLAVTSAELRHVNGTSPTCFAYVLQFGDSLKDGFVVLLLDGSVVTPETTVPSRSKSAELSPFDEPVAHFIKHAQTVYVFAPRSETATRPNDKDLRLLPNEAQQALIAVLSNQANWWHGLLNVGIPPYEKGSVGFLFRANGDELILFVGSECGGGCPVEGTFRGKDVFGMLNECAQPAMDTWKEQYASTEMSK